MTLDDTRAVQETVSFLESIDPKKLQKLTEIDAVVEVLVGQLRAFDNLIPKPWLTDRRPNSEALREYEANIEDVKTIMGEIVTHAKRAGVLDAVDGNRIQFSPVGLLFLSHSSDDDLLENDRWCRIRLPDDEYFTQLRKNIHDTIAVNDICEIRVALMRKDILDATEKIRESGRGDELDIDERMEWIAAKEDGVGDINPIGMTKQAADAVISFSPEALELLGYEHKERAEWISKVVGFVASRSAEVHQGLEEIGDLPTRPAKFAASKAVVEILKRSEKELKDLVKEKPENRTKKAVSQTLSEEEKEFASFYSQQISEIWETSNQSLEPLVNELKKQLPFFYRALKQRYSIFANMVLGVSALFMLALIPIVISGFSSASTGVGWAKSAWVTFLIISSTTFLAFVPRIRRMQIQRFKRQLAEWSSMHEPS